MSEYRNTEYNSETYTPTKTDRQIDSESSRRSSSSTTTKNTDPGVLLDAQDLESIRTGYEDVLGPLNMYKARDIEWAVRNGLEAGAILDALEQTAMARRPTHYYFVAILERYITFRITTRDAAEQDRMRYRAQRDAANRESWGTWYKDPRQDMPW